MILGKAVTLGQARAILESVKFTRSLGGNYENAFNSVNLIRINNGAEKLTLVEFENLLNEAEKE